MNIDDKYLDVAHNKAMDRDKCHLVRFDGMWGWVGPSQNFYRNYDDNMAWLDYMDHNPYKLER
jgi:hypothetical protein